MYKFMKWQEEDQCFVSYTGGQHPPMMQMSNLKNSPGAEAVRHLAHILTSGKIGQYHIHYEELSAGSPFFSFAMFVFIQRNNVMPCYWNLNVGSWLWERFKFQSLHISVVCILTHWHWTLALKRITKKRHSIIFKTFYVEWWL